MTTNIGPTGPTFEPDYTIQFFEYMKAREVLTQALCAIDLRSKGKLDRFLFKTALETVERAVREPPALLITKGALNLLEDVLKYLKCGEGDPDMLLNQTMGLIDEIDRENRHVVEMMFRKGMPIGYV